MKKEELELILNTILKYSKTIGDLKEIQKYIDKIIDKTKEYWNNKESE